VKKNKNIYYIVDETWINKWVRYVIGDSPPPTLPIDNSKFLVNRRVLNLGDQKFSYVKPIQWHYFKKTYGASPGIKLIFDAHSRNLLGYRVE